MNLPPTIRKIRHLNSDLLIRRLLGRATCVQEPSSWIKRAARIINSGNSDSLIQIGAHTVIEGELLIFPHGGQIKIGQWCYVGKGSRIWSGASITIGDRVLISHNVNIFDNQTHPLSPIARHQHTRDIFTTGHPSRINLGDRPIIIEDDVWIATGACILRGVTIGRGSIISANSVVASDIPPYSMVAPPRASVVRTLKPEELE